MSMSQSSRSRRFAAVFVVAVVLFSTAGIASFAQETAALLGTVFDPQGQPAAGFTVVFRDVATGKEIRSSASNAAGLYETIVPVGGRYKLQAVIAPDDSLLPVQDVPPIAIQVPGFNRLDVRFLPRSGAARQDPGAGKRAPTAEPKKARKSGVPWWKTPGGIVGIVVGVGAAAAIAAGGGGGQASPFTPEN